MSRATHRFTKRDVARLLRAAEAAGKPVAAIRVEKDGALVAVIGEAGKAESTTATNEWDRI
jgi:hypothetical protein